MRKSDADLKKVTTAFVLGAGLGTRLRPLTNTCPKPLLPVRGRPMITHAFDHLIDAGIRRLLVNTHHCAERYTEAFPEGHWRGVPLVFRHEPVLLETGGGIKNIEDLLAPDEPLLVYNGDVWSSLPLPQLLDFHAAQHAEVSLALRSTGGPLHIRLGADGRICDIRRSLGQTAGRDCLFSGIYIVEPAFRARFKPEEKISVIPVFLDMIRQGRAPHGIVLDEGEWSDLGTLEEYQKLCA